MRDAGLTLAVIVVLAAAAVFAVYRRPQSRLARIGHPYRDRREIAAPAGVVAARVTRHAGERGWRSAAPRGDLLQFTKSMTALTWMQHISVRITPTDSGACIDVAVSAPQLMTWGANRRVANLLLTDVSSVRGR